MVPRLDGPNPGRIIKLRSQLPEIPRRDAFTQLHLLISVERGSRASQINNNLGVVSIQLRDTVWSELASLLPKHCVHCSFIKDLLMPPMSIFVGLRVNRA
jgi:hypothetical protein